MKHTFLSALVSLFVLQTSEAADIFAPPAKAGGNDVKQYTTSAALLAATKSGEVPDAIKDWSQTRNTEAIGRSVIAILQKEYHVPPTGLRYDTPSLCGLILSNATKYVQGGEKDQELAATFQRNRKGLSDGLRNPQFMQAFDLLTKNYMLAVKESISLKQQADTRLLAAESEKLRQANSAQQKMDDARRTEEAAEVAKLASKRAEDETRTAASKAAMQARATARKQKLEEILRSSPYKLWQASLEVEEGMRMIASGQRVLDHDDAVKRESGVTDLTARRAAGERVVAGKELVQNSFRKYQQLGGTASTPAEVRAGDDPAKEYRGDSGETMGSDPVNAADFLSKKFPSLLLVPKLVLGRSLKGYAFVAEPRLGEKQKALLSLSADKNWPEVAKLVLGRQPKSDLEAEQAAERLTSSEWAFPVAIQSPNATFDSQYFTVKGAKPNPKKPLSSISVIELPDPQNAFTVSPKGRIKPLVQMRGGPMQSRLEQHPSHDGLLDKLHFGNYTAYYFETFRPRSLVGPCRRG